MRGSAALKRHQDLKAMCRRRQVPQPQHAMIVTLTNLRPQTVLPMSSDCRELPTAYASPGHAQSLNGTLLCSQSAAGAQNKTLTLKCQSASSAFNSTSIPMRWVCVG